VLDDTFQLSREPAKSAIWPVSSTKHGWPNHRFGYLVLEYLTISNRHDSYCGVRYNLKKNNLHINLNDNFLLQGE
jgi:hypothetical protein